MWCHWSGINARPMLGSPQKNQSWKKLQEFFWWFSPKNHETLRFYIWFSPKSHRRSGFEPCNILQHLATSCKLNWIWEHLWTQMVHRGSLNIKPLFLGMLEIPPINWSSIRVHGLFINQIATNREIHDKPGFTSCTLGIMLVLLQSYGGFPKIKIRVSKSSSIVR